MRLAFVSHSLPPEDRPLENVGGMQRVAAELLSTLRNHENLSLRVIEMRSTWRWIHVKILPFLFLTYLKLRSLLRSGSIDTVLFSSMISGLLVIPLRKQLRAADARTCVIVHGLDITTPFSAYQRLVRAVFERADVILPVSAATGDACVERGLLRKKVHVVHNGIDTSRFSSAGTRHERQTRLLNAFGLSHKDSPPDTIILSSVGRHVKRKGFDWFISAVMPLLPENFHYWLAGHGPETDSINRAIREHGLEKRVRLLGMLSDPQLAALYPGADLFVMPNVRVPNDMEGFGIVMLEAGLSGTPTVAAGIEGIREVIADGINGTLVASENADAFKDAILKYTLDLDSLETEREKAFNHTRHTFGWDTIADRYVQICSSGV